ncbi:hypothetical protein M758_4G018200 [Ceratodon purpureus]|nr:hypothetical protein M758_4G018200 [Ceratodon purpureus]
MCRSVVLTMRTTFLGLVNLLNEHLICSNNAEGSLSPKHGSTTVESWTQGNQARVCLHL